jgi:adenosylcobinamide-GDP ribazoletransferase
MADPIRSFFMEFTPEMSIHSDNDAQNEPFLSDLLVALRFYSRLPVPRLAGEKAPYRLPDFNKIAPILPIAALIIALPAALVLMTADLFFAPLISASLAMAINLLVTGAFHEDGLADVADGFGGGQTRDRRLEIMTDSRIGTYGASALGLSLILRITALAALLDLEGGPETALLWICAAPLSRMAGLLPMMLLETAKPDGKAAQVGKASPHSFFLGLSLALLIALGLPLGIEKDILHMGLATILALLAPWPLLHLAKKLIGGQTGDVAGAAQQVAEISFLILLSASGQAG